MRKLILASLIGATVVVGAGCADLTKLLTPPATNKPGTNTNVNTGNTGGQVIDTQAQLQQAAGFAANLQQAAGFGVILNGPTSGLQQAAGFQTTALYAIQSGVSFNSETDTATGPFGTGDLVADGTIVGKLKQDNIYRAFDFDLTVTTATKIPALQGAHITGTLALSADSADQGLKGEMTFSKDSTDTAVDFTYSVTGGAPVWKITGPVMINNVQHYTHLEVDSNHNGTGWVAKDKSGSTSNRVANCTGQNGKWTVKLLENPDATSSISMPW